MMSGPSSDSWFVRQTRAMAQAGSLGPVPNTRERAARPLLPLASAPAAPAPMPTAAAPTPVPARPAKAEPAAPPPAATKSAARPVAQVAPPPPAATPPVAPPAAVAPRAVDQALQRAQDAMLQSGVKLMTDILAVARPEVFQKATKVQRWARAMAKQMQVERLIELDLAALLYPLGIIALPDDLAVKYAADLPLADDEVQRIEESALVASRLIADLPRLEGVARAVFYARKGFDGSGWPKDGPSGLELPQSARILKVLIDLADAATGAQRTRADAFKTLMLHKSRYDPDVLAVAQVVLMSHADEPTTGRVMIRPDLALPGDVLMHDLTDRDGHLLLSAGTVLTELSARRLMSLMQTVKLPKEISVARSGKKKAVETDLPQEELF